MNELSQRSSTLGSREVAAPSAPGPRGRNGWAGRPSPLRRHADPCHVTPGYDAVRRFGSELSVGRYGWVMIVNFIILGLAVVSLGLALWRVAGTTRSGRVGSVMVVVAGLAYLDAGASSPT